MKKPKKIGNLEHKLAYIDKCDYCGGLEIYKEDHIGEPRIFTFIHLSDETLDPPIVRCVCFKCTISALDKVLGKPNKIKK